MKKKPSSKTYGISEKLTEKQAHALGVIQALIRSNPEPPTLSEIASCLDVKKQAVDQLLAILERKGFVVRAKAKRSIRLTDKPLPYATQKRAA